MDNAPTKLAVESLLSQLAEANAYRDALRLKKEELIGSVIPEAVKAEIETIEAEFAGLAESVDETIKELEGALRGITLPARQSFSGYGISVTYQNGRVSWDDKALLKIAFDHPEVSEVILKARKTGEPFTKINYTGKA